MKLRKILYTFVLVINIIGIICLIHFAVPYLAHDITIEYPSAMLPAEAWDNAGMALTVGFLPHLAANSIGFVCIKALHKAARFLFFIPSAVCLLIAAHYWLTAMV